MTLLRIPSNTARLDVKPKKLRKCCICRDKPVANQMAKVCGYDCAVELALRDREKRERIEAKKRAALEREHREAARPLRYHLKAAEKAVNDYVRVRDAHLGCCSCDKPSHWDGIWHASHFKSVGSNSVLRFNLLNIHKGCSECNLFKSGNIEEYAKRLTLKIGAEKVEWLRNQNGARKYTAEYLIRLKKIMVKKTKRELARQLKKQRS